MISSVADILQHIMIEPIWAELSLHYLLFPKALFVIETIRPMSYILENFY